MATAAARRFVKAGACVDETSGDFAHCALEHTRCEEGHAFVTSRHIEETTSLSHATRACLEPHSVQSIYGGRCSNPSSGEAFCTAHTSACQTGDFVLTRECTVLSNYLDGEYATAVYGSCESAGFCAFSANECPGDFTPATGNESVGDCTCLKVQTGACIRGGIPYCAVSQASCDTDEPYVHVPDLAEEFATTCFLCSNPFNPFDYWPTPYNGIGTPGKTPLTPGTNTLHTAPAEDATQTGSGTTSVTVEQERNLVGAKLALSFFVIGVVMGGLYLRWRRAMKRRGGDEQHSKHDRNLHAMDDEDDDSGFIGFFPWLWQGTRQGVQTAREEFPDWWDELRHERWPAMQERVREEMAKLGTNETFRSENDEDNDTRQPPSTPFRDWDQCRHMDWNQLEVKKNGSSESQEEVEIPVHDRDLLYEVAMEGAYKDDDEDDIASTKDSSPQFADDHLLQFDKALESSLSLLQTDGPLPMTPSPTATSSQQTGPVLSEEPVTLEGNATIEATTTTYEDLLEDGAEDDERVKGPVVVIQDNGSMLV